MMHTEHIPVTARRSRALPLTLGGLALALAWMGSAFTHDPNQAYSCPIDVTAADGQNCNAESRAAEMRLTGSFKVLAANDLGMHCADLDYQVFSILPPFNVIHAQVVQRGTGGAPPVILDDASVSVTYMAASNPNDPAGANSINTSSRNSGSVFKSNFWNNSSVALPAGVPGAGSNYTLGGRTYASLYPGVQALKNLGLADLSGLCRIPLRQVDCPSALALFEPLPIDLGIPVPDPAKLFPAPTTTPPLLVTGQQRMPGPNNTAQPFLRFDHDLPFFTKFPFGSRLRDVDWFSADGIPILPVDDAGRSNSYPLMKVTALDKATKNPLASLNVVVPVASEADCQNCHVEPIDCLDPGLPANVQSDHCSGAAVTQTPFTVMTLDDHPPGATRLQQLLNTAKINILRLHDAKHGGVYRNWNSTKTFAAMPCNAAANPRDPNCLANQTPIQCSRCHYSPALDLAQAGPVDEPEQGLRGRQQTRHVSMSRAMHGFHGALPPFQGKPLFPAMPAPTAQGRDHNLEHQILDQTCYQCHPGKRTQCLRGAMFTAGVVCQDCHGDMQQVGNDFSTKVSTATPGAFVLDGSLRVPWANEPACQSCHTGDAVTTHRPVGAIVAKDGIRLLQAYVTKTLSVPGLPAPLKIASLIKSPSSRFAENQNVNGANKTVDVLYRLSQGHGGVACEGCHNSTHAIWPNPNPFANDNVAANQLQGHTGTLIECDTCHAPGTLGRTLNGPHGMHPLDANWVRGHEDVAEHNLGACQSCHGQQLQGTVLSKVAQTRTFTNIEDVGTVTLLKGSLVSCALCHENPLFGD